MSDAVSHRFDVTGHVALISGASAGIGRHFATVLATAGAKVVVAARRSERLLEVVQEIENAGGHAFAVPMDVTRRSSVINALDEIAERVGVADIIVNNAGISGTKRFHEYTDDEWDAIIRTNLTGAWILAQESTRRMMERRVPGCIVNVTSILGERVAAGVAPYAASKAGLRQLTRVLALELAKFSIRVNSLAPGYIVTELNSDFLGSDAGDKLRSRIPWRRFGNFEDLNGALLLLASDAGAYITGAEIVVDGGHLCASL